ncbi:MAG TPA: SAM-dependent methyltransferase [bacterium]|nr:SAM-dependent methyltransferase [bacterium]
MSGDAVPRGTLYLVPVPVGDGDPCLELAPRVVTVIRGMADFVVENDRSARRFLSKVIDQQALDAARFYKLDEHTQPQELPALLEPLLAGRHAGIISEAGSPCVADPGTALVEAAWKAGIRVIPLPGPSAILMAIMASGLGGQRFSFNGYLPPEPAGREAALRELEARSSRDGSTQLFIETPYRNDAMASSAAKVLRPETLFCAATGLSSADERVIRMEAGRWRAATPHIGKIPTVFLLLALPVAGPIRPRNDAPRGIPPRRRRGA